MAPKRTLDDTKENPNSKKSKTSTIVSTMEDVLDKIKSTTMVFLKDLYIDLHNAAKTGNLTAVKNFLAAGIKVDTKNNDGKTALHLASQSGHLEIVMELLNNGANVDLIIDLQEYEYAWHSHDNYYEGRGRNALPAFGL